MHKARKRFGQHFLHDEGVLQEMAAVIAPVSSDHMVEIGPGLGVLTRYLVGEVASYDAIEIDRDLVNVLKEAFGHYSQFHLHEMDVLKVDWSQLSAGRQLRVVGNLPYNISTPLLFSVFNALDVVKDMHFLLQKEVGERLAATVGSHQYGRLSVMGQYYCDMELLFEVDPDAFSPPPKVDSIFLRMLPLQNRQQQAQDVSVLERVVATAFNQRRKTLRNSLQTIIDADGLERLGIDPKKRAQDVTVNEYITLANDVWQA